MARRVAGPDPGIPPDGNGRSRREADRAPPGEPALLPVRGEAHVPDHLGRALRRRPEPRLRLRALSRRAARPRVQPHADVLGDVPRGPRLVQDPRATPWRRPPGGTSPPGPGRRRPGRPTAGTSSTSTRWDDAYFQRLKTFCAAAGKRGIVVEFVLFCPFYEEGLWAANPMNAPEQRQRRRVDAARTRSSRSSTPRWSRGTRRSCARSSAS